MGGGGPSGGASKAPTRTGDAAERMPGPGAYHDLVAAGAALRSPLSTKPRSPSFSMIASTTSRPNELPPSTMWSSPSGPHEQLTRPFCTKKTALSGAPSMVMTSRGTKMTGRSR